MHVNPLKVKTKLPNANLPLEASAVNLDEQQTILANGSTPLDPENLYNQQVQEEFKSVNRLANCPTDPEPYMIPMAVHSSSFFDRKVDPQKVISLIVEHMKRLYDLSTDRDPYSVNRQQESNRFIGIITYLLPVMCRQVIELLTKEPLIVTVKPDVVVFGDLHGNFNDLWFIYFHFLQNSDYAKYRFVFLGDYVDRGPKPIEIVSLLFTLKIAYPDRIILLRGNHEVLKVNRKYGFQKLCDRLFENVYLVYPITAELIYNSVNRAFNNLPLGALIRGSSDAKSVFCCHGGIPNQNLKPTDARSSSWTIGQLNKLTSTMKPSMLIPSRRASPEHMALNELLWNDPIPEKVYI